MEALKVLRQALDEAQNELESAELALLEAKARADGARDEQRRLAAAVAALSGEPPPAAIEEDMRVTTGVPVAHNHEVEGAEPSPATTSGREDTANMTPEEFDAYRKRKQRQRQKEEQENNPFAHIKCSGCGDEGTMNLVIKQAPSGMPVRMMTCSSCGNMTMG